MEKMHGTISYLREAARQLEEAASRLDAQDGWHQEHALGLLELADVHLQRCKRHLLREIEARHQRLQQQS